MMNNPVHYGDSFLTFMHLFLLSRSCCLEKINNITNVQNDNCLKEKCIVELRVSATADMALCPSCLLSVCFLSSYMDSVPVSPGSFYAYIILNKV